MMAKLTNIIIHCSDSDFGDAKTIDFWHKQRGWKGIGYHYVILNGKRYAGQVILGLNNEDGKIEKGRMVNGDDWIDGNEIGAHCLGYNDKSIGICLIGKKEFTMRQFDSLIFLLEDLLDKHAKTIPVKNILGHYETESGKAEGKTCPNFNMDKLREMLTRKQTIPSLFTNDFQFK